MYTIYNSLYTPTIVLMQSRGVITLLAIYKIPKSKYVLRVVQYACRPSKKCIIIVVQAYNVQYTM